MKPIKVVQMLPALDAGGVETGTLEVGRHLVECGDESMVVSGGGRLAERLQQEGSRHINWPVGRKSPRTLAYVRRLRLFLEAVRPDILHLRSRVPAWIGWLAWRKMDPLTRPGLVTSVHGFYSVNRYSKIMTRGERVIAVSESIADYVREHYPSTPRERIRVIPRGVSPERFPYGFQPDPGWLERWRSEYPGLAGHPVITLPARITRWKGAIEFVSLMKRLLDRGHPVRGLIVGEPHPRKQDYYREVLRTIESAGLLDKVYLPGHRSDLREIMAVSEVVVSLSSDPEAFGRVTLEALALGRPTAGFDHGGVGEQLSALLPEGRVPVGDLAAMEELLDSWLREGAPKPARENPFTLERMVRSTREVYAELASQCP